MRITWWPASATEAARLIAVVVLPSDAEAPVISSERGPEAPPRDTDSVARSVR